MVRRYPARQRFPRGAATWTRCGPCRRRHRAGGRRSPRRASRRSSCHARATARDVVDLAGVVPLADCLIYLVAIEAALLDALLRVGRPDVVLDRHRDAGAKGTGTRLVSRIVPAWYSWNGNPQHFNRSKWPRFRRERLPLAGGNDNAGDRTRTCDLRIMMPSG